MTFYAITDTKKGRTGIAPTYLQTTHNENYIFFWGGGEPPPQTLSPGFRRYKCH